MANAKTQVMSHDLTYGLKRFYHMGITSNLSVISAKLILQWPNKMTIYAFKSFAITRVKVNSGKNHQWMWKVIG